MNPDKLEALRIRSENRRRPARRLWVIFGTVAILTLLAVLLAWPRARDRIRIVGGTGAPPAGAVSPPATDRPPTATGSGPAGERVVPGGSVLTVSGYIVARERIELSPRFLGQVAWIGVRKGDRVTNGQVVVRLDDSEYRARLAESDGQLAVARVALEQARLDLRRAEELVRNQVEMTKVLDDARLAVAAAEARIQQTEGARRLLETWVEWCEIRSPVDGVVLERMVDPNELVTPQTFGGTRGPSASLLAVADLGDLQVEIDLNESDLAKVRPGHPCRVVPEAFPDRTYRGELVEMAPEASRQKGTLQVKVRIADPDRFLTPELSARVDFLGEE